MRLKSAATKAMLIPVIAGTIFFSSQKLLADGRMGNTAHLDKTTQVSGQQAKNERPNVLLAQNSPERSPFSLEKGSPPSTGQKRPGFTVWLDENTSGAARGIFFVIAFPLIIWALIKLINKSEAKARRNAKSTQSDLTPKQQANIDAAQYNRAGEAGHRNLWDGGSGRQW